MSDDRVKKPSGQSVIAAALTYDGYTTPRVSAKGRDVEAEEILRLAQQHDVPIYKDKGLAELLEQIELGQEIPPLLFVAVAEVLAFTYQLQDLMWVEAAD